MRTAVALGSNLGDRRSNLEAARAAITKLPRVGKPVTASPVYETEPIDCEPGAVSFFNAVMEFEYDGDLSALLEELIRIEESLGRARQHAKNISRNIDIDLLYSGNEKMTTDELQLPHPRISSRRFVLQPLADIRPDLVLPGQTQTVAELLAELPDSSKVVRSKDQW